MRMYALPQRPTHRIAAAAVVTDHALPLPQRAVVQPDVIVGRSSQVSLVRANGKLVDLTVGMLHRSTAHAAPRLPEANRVVVARRAQDHREGILRSCGR